MLYIVAVVAVLYTCFEKNRAIHCQLQYASTTSMKIFTRLMVRAIDLIYAGICDMATHMFSQH